MKVEFRESFAKDLREIREKAVLKRVERLIKLADFVQRIIDIPNIKKLSGNQNYYRVRIGDYRIGLHVTGQTITFVRILHRKEIYRFFP